MVCLLLERGKLSIVSTAQHRYSFVQLLTTWQIQQCVSTQAPDDTWETRDLQNKQENRKRFEVKEAKRLQQEAEERLTMSPEEIGNQSLPC